MTAHPTPSADRVGRSFARNFHSYHANATLQAAIAEGLARRLTHHGAPTQFARGFEFGCGTGHLTRALRARFRIDHLTLNDLVQSAANVAREQAADFLPGDIRHLGWPDAPDLIASASTLQWMADPASLVTRAADHLAPGGWLALSGFGPEQYRELATLGSTAQAPGLCHADTLASALASSTGEYIIHEARGRIQRLWFTSPQEVLRHLRQTGVNGAAREVWTKARLQEFCAGYRHRFEQDGRVPLTYHPTWLIAQKRK
ncbi:methyltransferase domain-containing protein [Aliiroseovarius sp. KMU-50]|uniref:Methyltransferase domain-containing protein n=1 Tax=Aliiroseovarius salicola TaxID=3009082 RepID=A0ABT4W474_9RHOB|nr:methyltransferase domain-containing protein [Aliiroseovarius sp. KMU-50]MDA5095326.1 methyltransferase domain-containing protein [Aliiroseovarius sp. KMU-50]